MGRIVICLLTAVLIQQTQQVEAASSTVIGSTDAQRCYQESQIVLNIDGVKHCNAAIQTGDLSRRDLAGTYSNRGLIYAGNGEFDKALADHDKAIEILPTLAQAYINRGNVYYHMKQYEKALADYRRAIALEAGPPHVPHYNAGLALLRLKRTEEALAAFKSASEFRPDSADIKSKIDYLEALETDTDERS